MFQRGLCRTSSVNGRVGIDSLGLFGRTVPWKTRQPDDRHCSPSCGEPTELGTSTTRADHCSHRRGGSHRRRSSSPENQLRVPRRQLTLIVAALLASGLAGCSSNHGLEPLAARDRIQAVDGVTSATSYNWYRSADIEDHPFHRCPPAARRDHQVEGPFATDRIRSAGRMGNRDRS